MIRKCYESSPILINNYHVLAGSPVNKCIYRTVLDFKKWNVKVHTLEHDGKFVGYFGEELVGTENWLTGFFIMPEFRKSLGKDFWNMVTEHFNGSFKAGLYSHNIPAIKFLMKNGCEMTKIIDNNVLVFEHKENI